MRLTIAIACLLLVATLANARQSRCTAKFYRYCDEQPIKECRYSCWVHGGDAKPGGRIDRCIKALPDSAPYSETERCQGQLD
jgi:hypothetical protein